MSFAEIVAVVVGGVVIAAALCWCAVMIGVHLERRRVWPRGARRT